MFLQFRLGEDVQPFERRPILSDIEVAVAAERKEKVDDDDAMEGSSSRTPSPSRSNSPGPSRSSAPLDAAPISGEISPAQSENDPTKVMKHWQSHPRFPCPIEGCERRLTTQHLLRIHLEAHKPKPKASFPCRLAGCSKKYSRNHDRLRHEVEKHGKVCKFKCESCGKSMWRKKALENHECRVAPGTTRCVWMDAQ